MSKYLWSWQRCNLLQWVAVCLQVIVMNTHSIGLHLTFILQTYVFHLRLTRFTVPAVQLVVDDYNLSIHGIGTFIAHVTFLCMLMCNCKRSSETSLYTKRSIKCNECTLLLDGILICSCYSSKHDHFRRK